MKRALLLLLLSIAQTLAAAPTRYLVRPTYSDHNFVNGNLTVHGVTRRVRFPVTSLGLRDLPNIGKLAGFETTFTINRRHYGVMGSHWGAVPGVLSDELEVHGIVGAIRPRHQL
jgi:Uncharacterized conserved protein